MILAPRLLGLRKNGSWYWLGKVCDLPKGQSDISGQIISLFHISLNTDFRKFLLFHLK